VPLKYLVHMVREQRSIEQRSRGAEEHREEEQRSRGA
jgi:hypothetical protein